MVHLTVTNVGQDPFRVFFGGDFFGNRMQRFRMLARDAAGRAVPDPIEGRSWGIGGGLGGAPQLASRKSMTISAPLLRYCAIETPGVYSIEIGHDFGWIPEPLRPIPTATVEIEFVEPGPNEAATVLERTKNTAGQWVGGARSAPFADYSLLRFPVYLPLLEAEIRSGNTGAVAGLGHMKGEQATAVLLGLVRDETLSREVRAASLRMLACRAITEPQSRRRADDPLDHLNIMCSQLAPGAWTPALRESAVQFVRQILANPAYDRTEFALHGIDLLGELGDVSDLPILGEWFSLAKLQKTPAGGISEYGNNLWGASSSASKRVKARFSGTGGE